MPVYVGDTSNSTKVQLFISEMAINHAMETAYDNGGLIKGQRVPSTYVKTFFPNFEEVFGKHNDVFILIELLSSPVTTIRTDGTVAETKGSMRLMNPFNEEFDALSLNFNLKVDLEFELLEDFTIVGNVKEATCELTKLETYF